MEFVPLPIVWMPDEVPGGFVVPHSNQPVVELPFGLIVPFKTADMEVISEAALVVTVGSAALTVRERV
jgi:hypothetical protein